MANEGQTAFQQRLQLLFDEYRNGYIGKWSRNVYADHLGVSLSTLRGWLSGSGEPSASKLAQIARLENVTVDWLVGASNERQPAKIVAAQGGLMAKIANADIQTLAQLEQFYNYLEYQKQVSEGENKGTGT